MFDALSRKTTCLVNLRAEIFGFEQLKDLFANDKILLKCEGHARRAIQGKASIFKMAFCFKEINYAYREHL